MTTSEVLKAAQNYNIEIIGSLDFLTKKEEIKFLNILEKLKKEDIHLTLLNEDLIHMFLEIELNEKIIKTLKQINWDDFDKLFKEHTTKRREKIYRNYMQFLRNDLGIIEEDEPLETEKTLLESKEGYKKDKVQKNHFNKRFGKFSKHFYKCQKIIRVFFVIVKRRPHPMPISKYFGFNCIIWIGCC